MSFPIVVAIKSQTDVSWSSGVVMEDQARPRRCGHVPGKRLISPDAYADKLAAALDARNDLVVISRSDAVEEADQRARIAKYASLRPDALLIDGLLVNGSAKVVGWLSGRVRLVQTGLLYTYAFAMVIGLLVLIFWFVH